jgi:HD-GYP domain-containing protein (c-di-GMP phosphodiesterase class II)
LQLSRRSHGVAKVQGFARTECKEMNSTMKIPAKQAPPKPFKYAYAPHDLRVGRCAAVVAKHLGFSASDAEMIACAAALHDIGKLGISTSIWQKPGPLTPDEWVAVKRHPEIGANWLNGWPAPVMRLAGCIAMTHHERWDGTGYPLGLSGHSIPIVGRITMIVDQYDALRSARSYKRSFTHSQACSIILDGDDRSRPHHFDPDLLSLFRSFHQDFNSIFESLKKELPTGSEVNWDSMILSHDDWCSRPGPDTSHGTISATTAF